MLKSIRIWLMVPLVLACTRPATDLLRKQPPPPLHLELSVPDQPDSTGMKQAYAAAFREHFSKGLRDQEAARPDRIQLLVVVGNRLVRTEAENQLNTGAGQAGAVASGSPIRMLLSVAGPKSAYESQVERLGYRPGLLTSQVVLLKVGKDGFQETLKADPMAIVKRMRPLGEKDRNLEGILAEEGRALALETLALLQKKVGWEPPSA